MWTYALLVAVVIYNNVHQTQGRCSAMGELESFNTTDFQAIHPMGQQQCERKCLSSAVCQIMAYHVGSLTCYFGQQYGVSTMSGKLEFIVKQRHEIPPPDPSAFPCGAMQCSVGYSCITLRSGLSVCVEEVCGKPPNVQNAVLNPSNFTVLTTATYTCDNGYYAVGDKTITCKPDLNWTSPTLVCCQNGFTYDSSTQMMYQVITQSKKYSVALDYCVDLGAGLVKINSTQRMETLSSYLESGQYFTDATDLATEGQWLHYDGSAVDMSFFPSNEPNGGTGENCAIFGSGSIFYDVNCDSTRLFICEVR